MLQDAKIFYFEIFKGRVNLFKEDKSSLNEQIHETDLPKVLKPKLTQPI